MRRSVKTLSLVVSTTLSTAALTSGCATFRSDPTGGRPALGDLPSERTSPAPTHAQVTSTASYHFAMAQAYSNEGNPDRAIEEYKVTLMFDPTSAVAYARLATEYVRKGMLSQAMETCKEGIAQDGDYSDVRMILANLYSSSHEYTAAIEQLDAVLKMNPAHEEAVVYKAQALMDQDQSDAATRTLKAFVVKNSDSALGWYYLGRTFQKSDHPKEAEAAFLKAVDLRPNFVQALLSLGFLHEENRNSSKALEIYKNLFEEDQNVTAAGRISTIYLKAEKYAEALPYLEAIELNDPEDMNSRVKLGLVCMELKQYDRAIRVFTQLISTAPDSDRLHFYLGTLYEEIGRSEDAIAQLKNVPPSSKLFNDAVLHAANLLRKDGKSDEAKAYLKDAIVRSPRTSQFYVFLASMDEDDLRFKESVATLEKARLNFPEEEKILYYLGSLYERMGDTVKGMEKMQELLTMNPDNVDALNYVGYTWTVQNERLDDAEKYIRRAMKLKPQNPFILDSWGWHLYVRGRMAEAIVTLEKAISIKGDESAILDHLADAYARANLQEKALATYEKAAKYTDDAKSKEKIAAKIDSIRTVLVQTGRVKRDVNASSRSPASVSSMNE